MAKIYKKYTSEILFEDESLNIKELVERHKKNLENADLRGANLANANLTGADLRGACLINADLENANLRGADLRVAILANTDLRGAILRDANFRDANLRGADLRGAKLGDATILSYKEIGGIGNHKRLLRCFLLNNDSFYFMAGCFRGAEQELKEKVINKYGTDCEYIEAIEFLKNLCIKYKEGE